MAKREFIYETYDPVKCGYGNPNQWRAAFQQVFTQSEIEKILGAATPHQILNLPLTASQDEIKGTYRKLAILYHPDKNNGIDLDNRFQKLQAAYQKLSK